MKELWIMIAGPYTSGTVTEDDRADNLRALNRAALEVFDRGHIPVIGVNLALPIIETAGTDRFDEIMMPVSLAIAERCDAVLRVGGPSAGADDEVERIKANGGAAYTDATDIPIATT